MTKKILILTNVTGSTDVENLNQWIGLSRFKIDFENFYYAHPQYNVSDYDYCIAYVDTGWVPISKELEDSILIKCKILQDRGFKIVLGNCWESFNQISSSPYAALLSEMPFTIWDGGKTFFWFLMYKRYHKHSFKFDHTFKNFDFLYLNKTSRSHREKLFQGLRESRVLDNSLVSNHDKGIALDKEYEIPTLAGRVYPKYGHDRDIFEKPYNESIFNIVPETSETETFMTEKIWKPIIAGQPFVVHAKVNYLKELRSLGFETYEKYIDESYDTNVDNDIRIKNIVKLCRNIKKDIAPKSLEFYQETYAVRQHNIKNFFKIESLTNAVSVEIDRLFELVDRSKVSS